MDNAKNSHNRQQNVSRIPPDTAISRSHGRQQTQQLPLARTSTTNTDAERRSQNEIEHGQWMEQMAPGGEHERGHSATTSSAGASSHEQALATGPAPSPSMRMPPRELPSGSVMATQNAPQRLNLRTAGSPAPHGPNLMDPRMLPPKSLRIPSNEEQYTSLSVPGSLQATFSRTGFTMGRLDEPFSTTPTPRPQPSRGTGIPGGDGEFLPTITSPYLEQSNLHRRSLEQQRRSLTISQSGGGGRHPPFHGPSSSPHQPRNQGTPMVATQPRPMMSQQTVGAPDALGYHLNQGTSRPARGFPPALQVPPLDLARRHFATHNNALTYIMTPSWRPTSKSHCVPVADHDRLPYVKKLYDAMVDSTEIWDANFFREDALRFRRDGWWGLHPEAIEAVCHKILQLCLNVHNHGVTGQALRCMPHLQTVAWKHDREFTFAERIHWMAFLMRHFKFNANMVMREDCILLYLARVWSTLMEKEEFIAWWNTLSKEQIDRNYDEAYEGVPARPMSREEKKQYVELATREAFQATAAQQQQASQAAQSQQAQAQAQTRDMTKRPVEVAETPEAGPLTKRPSLGRPSAAPDAPQESVQEQVVADLSAESARYEQTQEQFLDDEMADLQTFTNKISGIEEESFADRRPSPGDEDHKYDSEAEQFSGASSVPSDQDSDGAEEDHTSIRSPGDEDDNGEGEFEDEDADRCTDNDAEGEVEEE
ncbi:hypothetical protein FB567DRAFT_545673 [Paraphoma chrysanthemicola]|uniref:Uncharacterized protein n=1 Tax=Paraphoma chrysanthemicola TaxID=798071 RepID=A0A8K0RGW1_9PLEO|nr:hypothetical protein FB567DRAFT_545673 [Paraphoma chrysanthemicola]